MTKLKMGIHNRITSERFHTIKGALAGGMSDGEVMARYEIKKTTLRYIKSSTTFYEYRLRTETLPAARKISPVVMPSSGLALEDYGWRKSKRRQEVQMRRDDDAATRMVGIVSLTALIFITLIVGVMIFKFWSGE